MYPPIYTWIHVHDDSWFSPTQQTEDGLLKVLGVVTGSDLGVGDILLDINGEPVKGQPKEAVAAKLQGRAGSHVTVHVLREVFFFRTYERVMSYI